MLALLAAVVTAAGEPGYTVRYQSCIAAPPARTEAGRLACAQDELVIQTARLDAAEAKELARFPANDRAAAASAMQRWRADKDAACAVDHGSIPGAVNLTVTECRLRVRLDRLTALASRPGG